MNDRVMPGNPVDAATGYHRAWRECEEGKGLDREAKMDNSAQHPGILLRRDFVEPDGKTQTEVARKLGVSKAYLCDILNGKRPVSARMAIRLGKRYGTGAWFWVERQARYDLDQEWGRSNW